jgi:hypothetical protein
MPTPLATQLANPVANPAADTAVDPTPVDPTGVDPTAHPEPLHPRLALLRDQPPRLRTHDGAALLDDGVATVFVTTWTQPFIDGNGHDARSAYVERFWLPVLGPSGTWVLRVLSWGLEASPDGFLLDLRQLAKGIGLGSSLGRNSPLIRALTRVCQFDLATLSGAHPSGVQPLMVRHSMPWLSRRLVLALPDFLRAEHEEWYKQQHPSAQRVR